MKNTNSSYFTVEKRIHKKFVVLRYCTERTEAEYFAMKYLLSDADGYYQVCFYDQDRQVINSFGDQA